MAGPETYDVSQLLNRAQARKLLSYILNNDKAELRIVGHARRALGDDNCDEADLMNVLGRALMREEGEWEGEAWRYRFHTDKFVAVVEFEDTSTGVVITFWEKKR